MRSDVLPLGIKLDGRLCLVVGSGEEAERRIATLLDAGARIRVVSERPTPSIEGLAAAGKVTLAARPFEEADLDGIWIALLTDPSAPLAAQIGRIADARQVLFCAVDQPEHSSFSHLALARSGPVTVAISTGGRAPSLARRLREELQRIFDDADLGRFAEQVAVLRDETPSAARHRVLGDAVRDVRLEGRLLLGGPMPREDR